MDNLTLINNPYLSAINLSEMPLIVFRADFTVFIELKAAWRLLEANIHENLITIIKPELLRLLAAWLFGVSFHNIHDIHHI